MNKIPEATRIEIVDLVFSVADEHRYLERTRPENALFIERLIKDSRVGGRLADYMPADQIKTYIKDAVLNKYSKSRRAIPQCIDDVLERLYGEIPAEIGYSKTDKVSVHRLTLGTLVVAGRADYSKWETGIRKLVYYAAARPGLSKDAPPELVLVIFQHGLLINEADKRLTICGLEMLRVKCAWA